MIFYFKKNFNWHINIIFLKIHVYKNKKNLPMNMQIALMFFGLKFLFANKLINTFWHNLQDTLKVIDIFKDQALSIISITKPNSLIMN